MTQRNDGGPAFPSVLKGEAVSDGGLRTPIEFRHEGMTLRDYFAAKAMQGLISSNDEGAGDRIGEIPDYAYAIADAMIEKREES